MTWPALFLAMLVSHAVGDFLFQTDWEARNKGRGLSGHEGGRALGRHVLTYTLAFVPEFVWIANNRGALRGIEIAALVLFPHLLLDDGRFVRFWLERVKGVERPGVGLSIAVDQSFHLVTLLGAALLAVA